jgi:putative membrane protein
MLARVVSADAWRWQPHPEVWFLIAALTVFYVYAARKIGPKAVPAGQPTLTRANKAAFGGGMALLWFASDWPVHDIAEEYLYFVHMSQHLIFTLVMAPLLLLATPRWLADLVLGDGRVRRVIARLATPVVAGVVFNAVTIFTHWPAVVNRSVESGALHYSVHVLVVFTALMMWIPVCGPIVEWRISLPAQMVYLFLMSVVPTVPGAWLTFATNALYESYDTSFRLSRISVEDDQQAAGLIMKLGGGSWLWVIITAKFFVWANRHEQAERAGRRVDERDVLTWAKVEQEFSRSEPAAEPRPTNP